MNELSREEIDAIMKKQGLVYGWWKDNMKGVNKMKCLENATHIDEYINSIMAKCTEQTEVLILCEMAKGYLKEQRPHGEWKQITEPDIWGKTKYQCSVCKYVHRHSEFDTISFCENCGADMRKEGDEK